MDNVSLIQQQAGEIRTVLTGGTSNESSFPRGQSITFHVYNNPSGIPTFATISTLHVPHLQVGNQKTAVESKGPREGPVRVTWIL